MRQSIGFNDRFGLIPEREKRNHGFHGKARMKDEKREGYCNGVRAFNHRCNSSG